MNLLAGYFKELLTKELSRGDVVVVSPDVGGVARARKFAVMLKTDIAIVDKRRSHEVANVSEVMDIIGDVGGRTAILVDDIIDTAGTICNAARGLKERGCGPIYACATHGVLSDPAIDRINESYIKEMVFLDTIPFPEGHSSDKISYIPAAPMFAEAIRRIYEEVGLSSLFR